MGIEIEIESGTHFTSNWIFTFQISYYLLNKLTQSKTQLIPVHKVFRIVRKLHIFAVQLFWLRATVLFNEKYGGLLRLEWIFMFACGYHWSTMYVCRVWEAKIEIEICALLSSKPLFSFVSLVNKYFMAIITHSIFMSWQNYNHYFDVIKCLQRICVRITKARNSCDL